MTSPDNAVAPTEFESTTDFYRAVTHNGTHHLYGVADSARDTWLPTVALDTFQRPIQSLFDSDDPELLDAGPFLIEINDHFDFLETWLEEIGKSSGVLLTSSADFASVRAQLIENFNGCDESGATFFFRFYDPRVLRDYLPTCTPSERKAFFGPIDALLVEDESGTLYLRYHTGAELSVPHG